MAKSNKKEKKVAPKLSKKELKAQAKAEALIRAEKEAASKTKKPKKEKKVKAEKPAKESNVVDIKSAKKAKPTEKTDVTNVFTAVGLDPKHRDKPWQLVRHYDEVTVERNKNAFPYIAEEKYDGNFCAVLVLDGEISAWSRTGNKFNNTAVLLSKFKAKKDGFYISEAYVPKAICNLEKWSGIISPFRKVALTKPQQKIADEDSMLAVFDYITVEEFKIGKSMVTLENRIKRLHKNVKLKGKRVHVPFSQECKDENALRKMMKKLVKDGGEGIVIKGKENPYVAGHQNFHFMKMVKRISFDLLCTGVEVGAKGSKREGMVTNLLFKYKDKTEIKADLGKGYEDTDRRAMAKAFAKGKKGKTPVGHIFEVYALETSAKGILRQPKTGELRHDKKKADF